MTYSLRVTHGVEMAVDVALQVTMEFDGWREENQTDPHQFPASHQTLAEKQHKTSESPLVNCR